MARISFAAAFLPALAAAALAPSPALAKEAPVTATPAGKPIDCILTRNIRETRVRDDSTIDFFMNNRKVYRNTLPYACSRLGFEERFGYRTTIGQLCSIDTITVLQTAPSGIPGPTCGLGPFQPVTIAKAPKPAK
ncbi:hypothetical protein PQ455_05545 [Sphingomonas naphthae]|uniref:Uncharacterized protein n=1 Tax=Sphingomonas naphthae TaxID=1813468 RepID=A0ABY7TN85_9SPHN|nr:hypothetical protein [Sphingomonas naphthae]WCT74692.1 hypothetical protein PQ455_05545 [Sphingomonas naphthae]